MLSRKSNLTHCFKREGNAIILDLAVESNMRNLFTLKKARGQTSYKDQNNNTSYSHANGNWQKRDCLRGPPNKLAARLSTLRNSLTKFRHLQPNNPLRPCRRRRRRCRCCCCRCSCRRSWWRRNVGWASNGGRRSSRATAAPGWRPTPPRSSSETFWSSSSTSSISPFCNKVKEEH